MPQNSDGNETFSADSQYYLFLQALPWNEAVAKMPHFDDNQSPAKRRKLDDGAQPDKSAAITSHKQLRAVLVFQQNAAEAKQGNLSVI